MSTARPSLLAVCTTAPWPVTNGYTLRVFHLLQELSRVWSITLVSLPSDSGEPPPFDLERFIPLHLEGTVHAYPWRFDQQPLKAAIDQAIELSRPRRAVVWRGAEGAWFDAPQLPAGVVDLIDCVPLDLWSGFLIDPDLRGRYRKLRELGVSAYYSRRTVKSFSSVICAGERDAAWLRWLGREANVHVVPNGVLLPERGAGGPRAPRPTLSFIGTLDFEPNVDAALFLARDIWPRVRAARPDAQLLIAGRNPTPEILALRAVEGLEVLANVPDMNAVLARSWLSIAPMRGGVGVKNKVLEAWAASRPVALTPLAVNGLKIPDGHEDLVQSGAPELAEAVIRLFGSPDRVARMGEEARAHVGQHYAWRNLTGDFDHLLRHAVADDLTHRNHGFGTSFNAELLPSVA